MPGASGNFAALIVESAPGLARTMATIGSTLEALGFEVVVEASADLSTPETGTAADRAELVLMGPTVGQPVAQARRWNRRAPRAHVIFLVDGPNAALREELSSPVAMVGAPWTIIDLANGGARSSLEATARSVRQRLQARTTLGRMNVDLSMESRAVSALNRYTTSHRFLARILDQADDAIIATTPEGTIVAWNLAAAGLFDLAWDDAIGRPIHEVASGEWQSRLQSIVRQAASAESGGPVEVPFRLEMELPDKEDRSVEIEVIVSSIREDDDRLTGISLIVRDVTVRNELEKRVQAARRLESLGVLAGGVAHKINNFLTAVLWQVELAASHQAHGSEALESLTGAREMSLKAAELCRQILAFAGGAAYEVAPLDINEAINDMVELLAVPLRTDVRLELELAHDIPPVAADVGHLKHVLLSLVTNAAEAIGQGPGRVSIATRAQTLGAAEVGHLSGADGLEPGPYVVVEIADDGCGMDAETLVRIYEPFFSTKFTGRGLGLSEALGVVRAHGGGIGFESAPRKGTTARVCLPIDTR